ncbi:CHAD domain-containing protein [Jiella endophytica]|uniref:CHAD domain-containing protein n=1 Tax=Jiella endophytica TaxID=2558362 RepID=A0A4Y8R7L5_9HYPH|nr:CHAD domain-containing protein [Jiella endophytica]TFF17611.1 CHAD domain-containing protein [Jiella endophytica]
MAYQIRPSRPLDAEFRKVAIAQIDRALADLRREEGDIDAAIHEARKRFKKLRGLVRLIRPADAELYAALNASFREGAGGLSGARDKAALIEALGDLNRHFGEELSGDPLASVRERLVAERDAASAKPEEIAGAVRRAIGALEQARPLIEAFQLGGGKREIKRAGRVLGRGAGKTHGRARQALKRAEKSREADDLHELRKRVKYHWMHLRLLSPAWPEAFKPAVDLAKQIADDLGRDHDYSVLRGEIRQEPAAFGDEATLSLLIALLDRRQSELRETSLSAARKLLAEESDAFERRIERLYRLAAQEGERDAAMPAETAEAERRVA